MSGMEKRFSFSHATRFLGVFRRDKRGNFATIFALALIPILVAMGAAVDISRAYVVQSRLRSALDAAGLAVGTATGKTTSEVQAIAQAYFDANYPADKLGVPGAISVSDNGDTVDLSVTAELPTTIMGIVGIHDMNVSATSQIKRQGKKLEVALVLDNTGSMGQSGKLQSMKDAAKLLLDTLKNSSAATNTGDVRVALVPFTVDVNVGTDMKNENWIRWSTKSQQYVCTGYWWWQTCEWKDVTTTVNKNQWNGCVADRDQDYDVSNSTVNVNDDNTKYPAESDNNNSRCPSASIVPLTDNWDMLTAKINAMVASGNTNTTIGLAWGWNMVTFGGPESTAAAKSDDLEKAIVFLTDGENTQNRFTSSQNSIDARTEMVCDAIRDDDIKVYTIRVIDGNVTLLRNCATESDMYYDVSQANELKNVFASIALQLSNLRIAK